MIKQILDELAHSVIELSPYRRTLVSLYEQPISPVPDSATRVLEYASCGLSPESNEQVLLFIAGGGIVRGDKYLPSFRISASYYIPSGTLPYPVSPWITSRRRFINVRGWQTDDLLLVPLWTDSRIIGQISVDDPKDGARPSLTELRKLEDLADVTAIALMQARQQEDLTQRHRLFHFLTENAMTGVLIAQGERIRYANDHAIEIFGYPMEQLTAVEPWWQLFHPDDRMKLRATDKLFETGELEVKGIRNDGGSVWLKLQPLHLEYEGKPAILINLLDISERVRAEVLLKEKAFRDPLTGLFNRHYFDDSIQMELKRAQRYKRPFTLMMTDLSRFKRINDTLGHQEGDRILHDVAHVVQEQLRESDWATRYGGDEFLLVLPETGVRIEALAQRLRSAVEEWSKANLPDTELGIDVGWATWTPEDDLSLSRLLKTADKNMYAAKNGLKG
jgi:diguanylate cyclase (GGDEF)-like protein/PAS domain S-box-containing protein